MLVIIHLSGNNFVFIVLGQNQILKISNQIKNDMAFDFAQQICK